MLSLPLLPVTDIQSAFNDVKTLVTSESTSKVKLDQLCRYVQRQWLDKSNIGPTRLSVRDNTSRTNNAVESFHAALRRRVQVAHPNLYTFLGHLQRVTKDSEIEMARLNRGLTIRRPKKRRTSSTTHVFNLAWRDLTTDRTPGCSFCAMSVTVSARTATLCVMSQLNRIPTTKTTTPAANSSQTNKSLQSDHHQMSRRTTATSALSAAVMNTWRWYLVVTGASARHASMRCSANVNDVLCAMHTYKWFCVCIDRNLYYCDRFCILVRPMQHSFDTNIRPRNLTVRRLRVASCLPIFFPAVLCPFIICSDDALKFVRSALLSRIFMSRIFSRPGI